MYPAPFHFSRCLPAFATHVGVNVDLRQTEFDIGTIPGSFRVYQALESHTALKCDSRNTESIAPGIDRALKSIPALLSQGEGEGHRINNNSS